MHLIQSLPKERFFAVQCLTNIKIMKKIIIFLFFVTKFAIVPVFSAQTTHLPISFDRDSAAIDSVQLGDFVGKYIFKGLPFNSVHVSLKKAGKLHLEGANRVVDVPPTKDKPDTFEIPEAVLTFVRNDKKEVVKLIVNVGEDAYEGSKVTK